MASITFVNRVRYKACYMRFTSSTQKEVEHPEEEINHLTYLTSEYQRKR